MRQQHPRRASQGCECVLGLAGLNTLLRASFPPSVINSPFSFTPCVMLDFSELENTSVAVFSPGLLECCPLGRFLFFLTFRLQWYNNIWNITN